MRVNEGIGDPPICKKNYLQMLNRQRQENDSPWQRHGITKEVRKYDYENPFYV